MTERPILFQGAMVRAILSGAKTQTRRMLSRQPPANTICLGPWHHPDPRDHWYAWTRDDGPDPQDFFNGGKIDPWEPLACPYGQPGDRLWVRETLKPWTQDPELFAYAADDTRVQGDGMNYPVKPGRPYVPSIHLARCWARILLEVTEVRVERLQSISEDDARAEGVETYYRENAEWVARNEALGGPGASPAPRDIYWQLWETINGRDSWDANPWVWAVSFRRVTP